MKFHVPVFCLLALLHTLAAEPKVIHFEEIKARWSPLPLATTIAAAERGDPTAQHYLGRSYMEGAIGPRDPKAAVEWYEKAVAQDFPNSLLNLGIWLYWGEKGLGSDRKRGVQLLRKAAETGEPLALNALARVLETEGNPAEAEENFLKSAGAGNLQAMRELARMHSYGIIERNYEKAYQWLKKAADAGDAQAMANLADFLSSNYEDFPARPEESQQWRMKAMTRGYRSNGNEQAANHRDLQRELVEEPARKLAEAQKLEQGDAVARRRALEKFEELSEDDPTAAFKSAQAYESGQLAPRDDRKALEYYARSFDMHGNWAQSEEAILRLIDAGRGLGSPQENMRIFSVMLSHGYQRPPSIAYRIARHYDEGRIIPPDLTTAMRLYREAALRGSAEARNRIGELWLEGVNGEPDPAEAAKWFRNAASSGYARAQLNIGKACSTGAGVPRDPIAAYKWLTLASANGDQEASRAISDLKPNPAEQEALTRLKSASSDESTRQAWLRELSK